MNYFKRKRIFTWLNMLMFIISITIIVSIAWKKSDCNDCNTYYIDWIMPSENIKSIEKEIGLTKLQKTQIEKKVFELYSKNEKLLISKKEILIKIYNILYNSPNDTNSRDSLYKNLDLVNRELDTYIYNVLFEIDKILTPEQRLIQKKSLNELIKFMESQYVSEVKKELEKQKQILDNHK